MGQESTGSSRASTAKQMSGRDSPTAILTLPADNVPNQGGLKLPKPAVAPKTSNDKV